MRGGDHWKLAAGNVAADRLHGDVFVAKDHTGHRFDLDIEHAVALGLGEIAHLFLGELQVGHVAVGHLGHQVLDLGQRQFVGRR